MAREMSRVTLRIDSPKLTAQEIEQRVGLKPDISWAAGDQRGAFGARERHHGFMLESAPAPSEPFANHLRDMIKRLSPYAQKIGALGPELEIEMVCSLHRRTAPAVEISRDDIRWIGIIGARLKIDVQIVSDAPRGGEAKPPASGTSTGTSF